jgi:hypothetical protein
MVPDGFMGLCADVFFMAESGDGSSDSSIDNRTDAMHAITIDGLEGVGIQGISQHFQNNSGCFNLQEMPFPLRHPQFVLVDQSYDREFSRIFAPEPPPPRPSWVKRLLGRLT